MITSRFDHEITTTARMIGGRHDPRLWKAQLWSESGLNQFAVSPVGARGLAQIMPATWAEQRARLAESVARAVEVGDGRPPELPRTIEDADCDPFDAWCNLYVGAFYMRWCIDRWVWERPMIDRLCLAWASYNAGVGSLLDAQKLTHGEGPGGGYATDYATIVAKLPEVTGRRSSETVMYVRRILQAYSTLVTGPGS